MRRRPFFYDKMSTEIEHGWNDNHRSDDRVDVARDSERERERQGKKRKKKIEDFSFSCFSKTNVLVDIVN